jgi:predicted ATPase/class 3 adenylate cyclase/tetratricopeptide (TPR) repeat protein
MRSLPTGVVTLLFTDIEGSTTLLERHPIAYRDALKTHHRLLNEAVEGHDGVVFERLGDGVYAAFPRTSDAVAAAVQAQLSLRAHDWGELGEVRVRMAVHPGELDRWDDRYFGPALYRCARLLAVGHGGQTLLSGLAAEIVGGALPLDCELRDLGNHRLKDLRAPEHVFQIVHKRLRVEFPALRSLESRPHNIPVQLTSFVGRENELKAVRDLLSDVRLITLTGPGGSGKTRFALQLAAEVIDRFADGVFIVELAPIADPLLVLPTIAKTLGISERVGTPLADDLRSYLHEKTLLLVVDNFEHVVPAAEVINDLLRSAPKLKVLVTSREVLRLSGERDFAIPPLVVPSIARSGSVAEYAAIQLFIDRAQAVQPGFVLNGQTEAVIALCQRLDGLPLAIELAAARTSVLSPQQILARLDDRMALLERGPRDVPTRQRTLRAAIEWSYDLLTPDERRVFARLAAFAGNFALDAAEAVSDGGDLSSSAVDLIASLVDKSLIERLPVGTHEPRFRMLETIRAYASGRLDASLEADVVRDRHALHYMELAEVAEPRLRGNEQILWLDRLDRELDNIRAAMGAPTVKPDVRLRLGSALWRFCVYRAHTPEARTWLRIALGEADGAEDGLRAKALYATAALANESGESGLDFARESLQLRERLGDREGMAWSTLVICNSYGQEERVQKRACLEQAVGLFAEVGERWGYARSIGNLGGELQGLGEIERAIKNHEQALEIFRKLGDVRQVASELGGLASAFLWQLGDHVRARAPLQEALQMLSRVGDARSLCGPLLDLATIETREGEYVEAERFVERALSIGREFGDRSLTVRSLLRLGILRSTAGDHAGAEQPLREAMELAEGAEAPQRFRVLVMSALTTLGINALRAGNPDEALALHRQVLAAAREIASDQELWAPLGNLGMTYLARGEHATSAAYFKEHLEVTTRMGQRRDIHEPFEGLAVIAYTAGDATSAALLAGAADAQRHRSGEKMVAAESARYLPVLDRLREALGPDEFAKHWDRGHELTADQALETALRIAARYGTASQITI